MEPTPGQHAAHMVDFSDPTQVAYVMQGLRGEFALLQQQTSGAIHNLTSSMQSLQADVRDMGKKLDTLTTLQHGHEAHGHSIERAFKAIADLAEGTSKRLDHMAEQQSGKIEALRGENKDTRDKVLRWSGGAGVLGLIAAIGVSIVLFYEDRDAQRERDSRMEMQETVVDNGKRLREVELFLERVRAYNNGNNSDSGASK